MDIPINAITSMFYSTCSSKIMAERYLLCCNADAT